MASCLHPEDPMPIVKRFPLDRKKEDLNELLNSTSEYYGSVVDRYVLFYEEYLPHDASPEYRQGYERVAELLQEQLKPNQHILELGCGIGYWTVIMAQRGAALTSVDSAPTMLSKCRERIIQKGLEDRINLLPCDASQLNIEKEQYDGAVLNSIMAHLLPDHGRELLRRMRNLVRPGGFLFVSDSYWRGQEGGKEQVQMRETPTGLHKVYKYYYDLEELKSIIGKNFGPVVTSETTTYEMILIANRADKG